MNLELKEILFELVNQCNRSCHYCGSKNISLEPHITARQRKTIVTKISKYLRPRSSVTFTGGEPLILPYAELSELVKILHNAEIDVRVVTNGDNLIAKHLSLFSVIGISINEQSDIDKFKPKIVPGSKTKVTAITNFGTHNIWHFDAIDEFVNKNFDAWQIQLTMGNYQLDANGIKYLYEKISKCKSNYMLSDNLQQSHQCSAGLNTMSITHDGYCIPCLSIRAWGGIVKYDTYNLLKHDLCDIWENQFKEQRFYTCASCRNHITYPKDAVVVPTVRPDPEKAVLPPYPHYPEIPDSGYPPYNISPLVFIYGVATPKPWGKISPPYNDNAIIMYGIR